MEIWKRNRNNRWQKRKSHTFSVPITGSLYNFLRSVKSRKRTSGSRFIVFEDGAETRELERITRCMVSRSRRVSWDEITRLLGLILQPLPFATAKLMSPFAGREVNGEPASIRRRIVIAIEIK